MISIIMTVAVVVVVLSLSCLQGRIRRMFGFAVVFNRLFPKSGTLYVVVRDVQLVRSYKTKVVI